MDTGWLIEEMDDEEEEFLEYLEKTRCNCQAETLHFTCPVVSVGDLRVFVPLVHSTSTGIFSALGTLNATRELENTSLRYC